MLGRTSRTRAVCVGKLNPPCSPSARSAACAERGEVGSDRAGGVCPIGRESRNGSRPSEDRALKVTNWYRWVLRSEEGCLYGWKRLVSVSLSKWAGAEAGGKDSGGIRCAC